MMINVTHACFGLSYLLALGCELFNFFWPHRLVYWLGLFLGIVGVIAHTLFLGQHQPSPASAYGSFLGLAWILAIFYLIGAVHHSRQIWSVLVIPFIAGLVSYSWFLSPADEGYPWLTHARFWGILHGVVLVLAAVGITISCIASLMYLIQADRLRRKLNPLGHPNLLSLERLETMARRGVNFAFPLLTVGLLLGIIQLKQYHDFAGNWLNFKVLGTLGMWLVFLVLFYLRYAAHVSTRRLAWLNIISFVLMMTVMLAVHPFAQEMNR